MLIFIFKGDLMTTKKHISKVLKVKNPEHKNFDFVDININDDQKLFIDPVLISNQRDDWSRDATIAINDFFRMFYIAYRAHDRDMKIELLSHAGEVNHTKLGYGNGRNGHGNTAEGLIDDFYMLEKMIDNISSISKVIDLPVLVNGFNEDGLSDLITNIIHKELNDYTLNQLANYGIEANSTDTFYTWDVVSSSWVEITQPCFEVDGSKILLMPKQIVRKNYLFSADQYIKRIILEREKVEKTEYDVNGKIITRINKRDLEKNIVKKSKHWRYDFIEDVSTKDSTYLDDYHNKINSFYAGKGMDDEELDSLIY